MWALCLILKSLVDLFNIEKLEVIVKHENFTDCVHGSPSFLSVARNCSSPAHGLCALSSGACSKGRLVFLTTQQTYMIYNEQQACNHQDYQQAAPSAPLILVASRQAADAPTCILHTGQSDALLPVRVGLQNPMSCSYQYTVHHRSKSLRY